MSAIGGISSSNINNANMIMADQEIPLPKTNKKDDVDDYLNKLFPETAGVKDARTPPADEMSNYEVVGNLYFRKDTMEPGKVNSKAHDSDYFKTGGAFKETSIVKNGNLAGYDVSTSGATSKVMTHGGVEVSNHIAGTNLPKVKPAVVFDSHEYADASPFCFGASISNEGVAAVLRDGYLQIDARYNFPEAASSNLIKSGINDMGNTALLSGRFLFDSRFATGSFGLTFGRGDFGEDASSMFGIGGNAASHIFDHSWQDGKLELNVDANSQFSYTTNDNSNIGESLNIASLLSTGLAYHLTDDITLGAGLGANIDAVQLTQQAMNGFGLPITTFTELSASYDGGNFDVGANVYVPITNFDNTFADELTWNIQGGYRFNKDLSLSASLTGNVAKNPISKVSVDAQLGLINVGASLKGINDDELSLGFNASVDLSQMAIRMFPSLLAGKSFLIAD